MQCGVRFDVPLPVSFSPWPNETQAKYNSVADVALFHSNRSIARRFTVSVCLSACALYVDASVLIEPIDFHTPNIEHISPVQSATTEKETKINIFYWILKFLSPTNQELVSSNIKAYHFQFSNGILCVNTMWLIQMPIQIVARIMIGSMQKVYCLDCIWEENWRGGEGERVGERRRETGGEREKVSSGFSFS